MRDPRGSGGQGAHPDKVISQDRQRLSMLLRLAAVVFLMLVLLAASSFLGSPPATASGISTPVELTALKDGGISTNLRDSQGDFHLLYITGAAGLQLNLMYEKVSVSGQSVTILVQPVALATQVDQILSPTLLLDSKGDVDAAWIEVNNGVTRVRQALVASAAHQAGDVSLVPQTLYSTEGAARSLTAGADEKGDTFYAWMDNTGGPLNLRFSEVDSQQVAHAPIQVTHAADALAFAHLAVYPDGTLVAAMLHQLPQKSWELNLYPFDATGKLLHDPTQVVSDLLPAPLNVAGGTTAGQEPTDFQNDPLAVVLDAQRTLHLAWTSVLGLGYASALLRADGSFAVQASALEHAAPDYEQLCLNAGPPTPPGQAAPAGAAQVWIGWIDDRLGGGSLYPFIAQVSQQGKLMGAPMALVDNVTNATDPCVQQDSQKGLYVTWQQFQDNGTYGLVMATTTVAPENPWWSRLGLNLNHPITQLLFLVFGSPLLALFIVISNVLAAPVAALVLWLGHRLRIPRLLVLLIALIPMVALSLYFVNFIGSVFLSVEVPQPRLLIGCATAVGATVYLWYRSRRFPPETMGAIGQLLLASYMGAVILAAPLIYLTTRVQLS